MQSIYLSNDDSMSLASAERVIWALENDAAIPVQHVRPHELLNYFSFATPRPQGGATFAVKADLNTSRAGARLAIAIAGKGVERSSRRPVNLAYVLDRSGSMAQDGRMAYLRRGLRRSLGQLNRGDILHITLFDSSACQLVQNFVVGRDSIAHLEELISRITERGSTNLNEGLSRGYRAADDAYVPSYSNRVVLITDAETNTGTTDPGLIAEVGRHYDRRRIRLSGIGVGHTFNDALLDELTERGRGAYVYLGNPEEVDAVFGRRFASLIDTVAVDVHFRLSLPPSLRMRTFFGEEASTEKQRVQAVHYFSGTSQLFLSDLELPEGSVRMDDELMLTIEYEDPETGVDRSEDFAFSVGDIFGPSGNLAKASFVNDFALSLSALAAEAPARADSDPASQSLAAECQARHRAAAQNLSGLGQDPEIAKVERLFGRFCDRFGSVASRGPLQRPLRNNDFSPPDGWPGASSRR